MSQLSLNLCLK